MNSRLLKISCALFLFGALFTISNSATAQCNNPIELAVTPDFDHVCSGDSLFAIITDVGEASCNASAGTYGYCYDDLQSVIFNFCPDNIGDGTKMSVYFNSGTIEVSFDNIQVFDGPDGTGPMIQQFDGDVSGQSFTATNLGGCISFILNSDASVSCEDFDQIPINFTVSCVQSLTYDISWGPAQFLTNPTDISTGIVGLTESTEFTFTAIPLENPECESSATVMVNFVDDVSLGINTVTEVCVSLGDVDLFELLDGNPDPVGIWLDSEGTQISNIFDPSTLEPGIYTHTHAGCEDIQVTLDISFFDSPEITTIGDFDYYCEGEDMWVNVADDVPTATCSNAAGTYTYCYEDDDNIFFSYCPDQIDGPALTLAFQAGNLESGFDDITVYNGPNDDYDVLENFDGDATGRIYSASNPTGCISFVLESDISISCESSLNIDPLVWEISCSETLSNYTYSWNNSEYLSDPTNSETQIFDLDMSTDFTVTISPILSPECISTATLSVNYISNLNIGVDSEVVVCDDSDPVNLFESLDGDPEAIGSWTDSNGIPVANSFIPPANSTTLFYYTNPSCTNSTELEVNAGSIPNVNAGNGNTICEGQSISLQASGAVTYEWIGVGTTNPVNVSPTESTTYTVIGYDAFGCYAEDEITIGVINTDAFQITDVDGVLTVDGGDDVQWYLDGFPILGATGPTFEYSFPGIYTASVDTGGQCDLISEPYEVIISGVSELEAYTVIYPQPVQSNLIIESKKDIASIQIISIDGKLVQTEVINDFRANINCSELQFGTYVVRIQFNNGAIIHKRVIKAD